MPHRIAEAELEDGLYPERDILKANIKVVSYDQLTITAFFIDLMASKRLSNNLGELRMVNGFGFITCAKFCVRQWLWSQK